MLTPTLLLIASLLYLLVLFGIAFWGDRASRWQKIKPAIYSLGLGVYCTSWSFYGVPGQTAETGWWITPTYTGAILVYILAWPLVLKVARICRDNNLTSMADFIATRYGRSMRISALISLVCVIAIVPYISLQIRAVANSVNIVTGNSGAGGNSALFFTLLLAAFAILFGTRRVRTSEHNPGLMLAIAFESIIKLLTFLAVGIFVVWFMFDGIADLTAQSQHLSYHSDESASWYTYVSQTFIGVLMMFCLPRQFHVCFIEQTSEKEMLPSRWLFPLYMLALNVFALPIASAGLLWFQDSQLAPDNIMLLLPMAADSQFMTLVSFLGGFAAATSMVIVSAIVLSIMVSNDLITPWLVSRTRQLQVAERLSPKKLILFRRLTIIIVLLSAWLYYQITRDYGLLANTGLMAMTLVAQCAPALLLGLFWRNANEKAALYSILVGTALWSYTLLLPTLLFSSAPDSEILQQGFMGFSLLLPTAMFGLQLDFISHGLVISLGGNLLTFFWLCWRQRPLVAEQLQASLFINNQVRNDNQKRGYDNLSLASIQSLLSRFLETDRVQEFFHSHYGETEPDWNSTAPKVLSDKLEQELSAIIGGASARLVLESASGSNNVALSEVVELVDEASEVYKFNRALLQSTIQNIDQGISVVDKELRIVAWNRAYIDMFNYPDGEIYVGRPVEEVIQLNAQRGLFGDIEKGQIDEEVAKRVAYLRSGKPYSFRRVHPSNKVLEMKGNPLPGGGFVTTYTDITEFVENQKALEELNVHLENRVQQRTQDLEAMNQRLEDARQLAVQANEDKTRYFAAISHDLLQPFNAATLFNSILKEKLQTPELAELSSNIQNALENAEQLVNSVLELTKLDAGVISPQVEDVDVYQLITPLLDEYRLMCEQKGLVFQAAILHQLTRTDARLLKRVLQNLLTNAIRYTESGFVNIECRIEKQLMIIVKDSGEGIKDEDKARIFKDFEQASRQHTGQGLGLGLAIASRICRILGHELSFDSTWKQGSEFRITLPCIKGDINPGETLQNKAVCKTDMQGVNVLVIDNEPALLEAMTLRLETWGCLVHSASNLQEALKACAHFAPDIIVADYHLDNGENGIDAVQHIRASLGQAIPVIINSADHAETIREMAMEQGFGFIAKPVKPATLKRLLKKGLG
ncbi:PAS domain-containing hybrid sensor histidine kinase/response regulator [Planctobacterium marinum]|uniref:PAS domain-containing hybrid sensor histidine kinase/response regulator n=1 Tax=Planctobacterium marinum TaxID=1631968 RepID=UPI001E3F04E4|nr:PAS domain-containing hybrid sensor histidine kinase/response regulator [Planctobacterium marinum]MCC2604843.1 hybrid sensor histidine kinase/response regulator [Planctobacterium marinum]